jgi:CubicO group peptidase (beta-lactamase class C family)
MNHGQLFVAVLGAMSFLTPVAKSADISASPPVFGEVESYARSQGTTGFLIVRDGKVLVEDNWPLGPGNEAFQNALAYGLTADGALLEDVASQQKSFVAILVGIAVDRKLIDVEKSVTSYLGAGWSKATPAQESQITVLNILEMNSGLNVDFTYEATPGDRFRYNTPVYAITKRIVEAAARRPLDQLTREWLTGPLGMVNTSWRQRPVALAQAANATGLVTTPRDEAAFGQMILDHGMGPGGKRIISEGQLHAIFDRSATNPAYGRLGKLYVVPSARLVVVRLGRHATDPDFDQQLWLRLSRALARNER